MLYEVITNTLFFIVDTSLPGVSLRGVELGLSGERAAHRELGRRRGRLGDYRQQLEQRQRTRRGGCQRELQAATDEVSTIDVITSYSIHYTKLYEQDKFLSLLTHPQDKLRIQLSS